MNFGSNIVRLLGCLAVWVVAAAESGATGDDERGYDDWCWLCTHNAMSVEKEGWKLANQSEPVRQQLEDGVRALMLDLWLQDGKVVVRHGGGIGRMLGEKPVAHVLDPVAAFLKDEPDAVVTLIFECYVPSRDVVTAIRDAGLEPYCFALEGNGRWPALGEMRKSGKRLVVMSDRVDPDPSLPPWLMKLWDHAWETDWQAASAKELLTREPRRGDRENELFILNHFVTTVLGASKAAAKAANAEGFALRRAAAAWQRFGQRPNFLVVDFYDVGEPGAVVAAINQAKDAQELTAASAGGE